MNFLLDLVERLAFAYFLSLYGYYESQGDVPGCDTFSGEGRLVPCHINNCQSCTGRTSCLIIGCL